jgi:hypothetical protein
MIDHLSGFRALLTVCAGARQKNLPSLQDGPVLSTPNPALRTTLLSDVTLGQGRGLSESVTAHLSFAIGLKGRMI